MTPRPGIFVSAVSKELKAARQLVSNTLQFLGYEPVWQDIFGTEQGDLRAMLRQKIDECKGVVQLVGRCYGAEPPAPDEQFGRVSYTQYEALYARQRGKKVWYLFLDEGFPGNAPAPEPPELQELQATYRRRLQADSHLYHPLTSPEALESSVLKLRDDLTRLRRGVKQWAAAVLALLVVLVGAVIWIKSGQRQQNQQLAAVRDEMAKMRQAVTQFPEVQGRIRQEQRGQNAAEVQQRTYEELGRQLGVDPKRLQEKLPQFAKELQSATDATTYERANAAYVGKDYAEAGRLALAAAHEAQTATPPNAAEAIKALELAGRAADAGIEYADALRRYRDAAQLTDRARDPLEWARQQWNIGYVLAEQGQNAEAEKTYRGALEAYRGARGEEDEDVLALRNNVANALDDEGQYAAAEKEYREVLAVRERVLGPEHPDTLGSRHNLANALEDLGRYAEAEKEIRSALTTQERVLGPEHLDTVATRNDLAVLLEDEGRYADAEKEYRSVQASRTRLLGAEHPDTLRAQMNVANALLRQGQYIAAEKEYRDVLTAQERVLGPEHPDTLTIRNNLAVALKNQRKYADAEKELREVIALRTRVLGPEHPDTLAARNNLAGALKGQGRNAEAEKEFRSVLASEERVLGPEHPDTLLIRKNLANTLSAQDQNAEAEKEFRSVLAIEERVLGPKHPETLSTRANLAVTLAALQKYAEAETEFRAVLADEVKVLGPDHPETLDTEVRLAGVLGNEDSNRAEAETDLRDVLARREHALGPEHADTLNTRQRLASLLGREGKYADAVKDLADLLAIRERVLGPAHADTIGGRVSLSWYQLFARDFAGALATTEAGLKLDADNRHLETNHAHALLFLGRTEEAGQAYLKYRGQKMGANSTKTWEQVILQDFDDLEKGGLTNPEFARIRGLLAPAAK